MISLLCEPLGPLQEEEHETPAEEIVTAVSATSVQDRVRPIEIDHPCESYV
jgi:hypothetical protein